ncbi:RNA-directed DNA polymerase (Reverse transcriptase) [Rhynchospora pubera]|uniref:RNA-directed DNA polymerase (Reverse transcriptase) n=1 Tax=Rhynchospora pubera TaxID=906938 RepID=A0AAV8DMX1_9POAL|nr:RNA-directed DNA polymerase (Reverse transcriptase) [Rhynchospora pubera]
MKLISERLKPIIPLIVTQDQAAFVKGRGVVDNIILVREILHFFNQNEFSQQCFMFKSDINNAFDTIRWEFLRAAMELINMPQNLVNLIMNCIKGGKVVLDINGKIDGFIIPKRGLRQGCPMSPFLFILGMQFLTRIFQKFMIEGQFKAVKIAATAPAISHIMFADDLLVMGQANSQQVQHVKIHPCLQDFLLWLPSRSGRCGSQNETIEHLLFHCPSSKAVWFASSLAITVHALPSLFSQILSQLINELNEDECSVFFSLMWQIWKERCNCFFKGGNFDVEKVLKHAHFTVYKDFQNLPRRITSKDFSGIYELPQGTPLIIVDGSWDVRKRMGVAVIIFNDRGILQNYHVRRGEVHDALVAETNALLLAIQLAKSMLNQYPQVHIFTDSQIVVSCVTNRNMQDITSWWAEEVVQRCIQELQMGQDIKIRFSRKEALYQAHELANYARRGIPLQPCLSQNLHRAPSCFRWALV